MVALSVNQHELLSDARASGLLFGTESTGYLTQTHPTKEPGDLGGSEVPRVREDGVNFGEDYEGAASVGFDIAVLSTGADLPGANGDALDLFESTWRHPMWRVPHNAFAVLRSNMKGRTRRCYGRPRRFAVTDEGYSKKGVSTFLCDFTVNDGKWYDDVATTKVTANAGQAGGSRTTSLTVGGTLDAWPVVTLRPGTTNLVNPTIVVGPLTMAFNNYTVAVGQSLTIDPRPWCRQFVKNGNPFLPVGDVNPTGNSTLLRDYHLPAGIHQVTLTAPTLSATASATVDYRNTWSRW